MQSSIIKTGLAPTLLLTLTLTLTPVVYCVTSATMFTKSPINDVIFLNSLLFQQPAFSQTECGATCEMQTSCLTFTFTPSPSPMIPGNCRGHSVAMTGATNVSAVVGSVTYKRVLVPATSFVYQCASPITHCGDTTALVAAGCSNHPSGVYKLNVSGTIVNGYCDMTTDGGGWLVFLRRLDGSENFHRTWAEYKAGFGNPAGEYWLGLETMYRMTVGANVNYKGRNDIIRASDGASCWYATDHLGVLSEANFYKLDIWNYVNGSGCGDNMRAASQRFFSTYDVDNDGDNTANHAQLRNGGFWYYSTVALNPTGSYFATAPPQSLYWGNPSNPPTIWTNSTSFAEFKIKKV